VRTGVRVVSESREGEAGPSQANGNRAGARSPIEANPSSTTQEVSRRHGNGAANGASVRSADLSLRHHFHGSSRIEHNKHLISLVMEDRADLPAGAQLPLLSEVAPRSSREWDSSKHGSHVRGAQPVQVARPEGESLPREDMEPAQGVKRVGVEVALGNVRQFQDSQRAGQPAAAENVDSGQGPEGTDDNPQIGLKHDMHDFEKFLPAGRVNNCGDSSGSTSVLGKEIVPFGCFGAGAEVAAGLQSMQNKVEICSSKAASEENGYASTAAEAFHVRKAVQMTTGGLAAKEELSDGQLEAALLHSTDKGPKSEKYRELEIAVTESQQLGGPLNGSERVFEQCVRTIRWLEREGHLKAEFRRSFFTWLSLRATEAERKVVHIVMENMLDDPVALAAQLLDTFEEISAPKRLKVRH
jgi:hypothetical protein